MNQTFKCTNCGKTYLSRKPNSKFCSINCKKEFYTVEYKCDECGVPIKITRSEYDELISGKRKHIYCSRECYEKGRIISTEQKCEKCGKTFMVWPSEKDKKKYCSMQCFQDSRSEFIKLDRKICPSCGKEFTTYHHDQVYCSKDCFGLSIRDRVECTCDCCGKTFERAKETAKGTKNVFCSKECRVSFYAWEPSDIDILREKYKKIPLNQIAQLLSKPYSIEAIKGAAGRYGLYKSREWSREDEDLLTEAYKTKPFSQVLAMFPDKTEASIRGKARSMGLFSYFYLSRIYSDEEDNFIKDNYLYMSNEQIAEKLSRTPGGISARIWVLGLKRPREIKKDGYLGIAAFVRAYIRGWVDEVRKRYNYRCALTGSKSNIIIHHIRGFNLLLEEAITNINFEIRSSIEEYSDDELMELINEFLSVQEYYNSYICITQSVHRIFHNEYGYGDNTAEQWDEFVQRFSNGEFDLTNTA